MTPKLTPTEADREMAAEIYRRLAPAPVQHIIDGFEDDDGIVQLVAQHAATATAEERERCAALLDNDIRDLDTTQCIEVAKVAHHIRPWLVDAANEIRKAEL